MHPRFAAISEQLCPRQEVSNYLDIPRESLQTLYTRKLPNDAVQRVRNQLEYTLRSLITAFQTSKTPLAKSLPDRGKAPHQ